MGAKIMDESEKVIEKTGKIVDKKFGGNKKKVVDNVNDLGKKAKTSNAPKNIKPEVKPPKVDPEVEVNPEEIHPDVKRFLSEDYKEEKDINKAVEKLDKHFEKNPLKIDKKYAKTPKKPPIENAEPEVEEILELVPKEKRAGYNAPRSNFKEVYKEVDELFKNEKKDFGQGKDILDGYPTYDELPDYVDTGERLFTKQDIDKRLAELAKNVGKKVTGPGKLKDVGKKVTEPNKLKDVGKQVA